LLRKWRDNVRNLLETNEIRSFKKLAHPTSFLAIPSIGKPNAEERQVIISTKVFLTENYIHNNLLAIRQMEASFIKSPAG
jgi:hypothetical protein